MGLAATKELVSAGHDVVGTTRSRQGDAEAGDHSGALAKPHGCGIRRPRSASTLIQLAFFTFSSNIEVMSITCAMKSLNMYSKEASSCPKSARWIRWRCFTATPPRAARGRRSFVKYAAARTSALPCEQKKELGLYHRLASSLCRSAVDSDQGRRSSRFMEEDNPTAATDTSGHTQPTRCSRRLRKTYTDPPHAVDASVSRAT